MKQSYNDFISGGNDNELIIELRNADLTTTRYSFHGHANKKLLDSITEDSLLTEEKSQAISDNTSSIEELNNSIELMNEDLSALGEVSHTHGNRETLDCFETLAQNEDEGYLNTPMFNGSGLWTTQHGMVVSIVAKDRDTGDFTFVMRNSPDFNDETRTFTIKQSYNTSELNNDSGFITDKEIADIRAELGNIGGNVTLNPAFSVGTYATEQKSRAKTDYFEVGSNQTVTVENADTETFKYSFYQFDKDYNAVWWGAWITETNTTHAVDPEAFYFGLVVAKNDNTAFTTEDFVTASQSFTVYYSADSYDDRINANSEQISEIQKEVATLHAVDHGAKMIYPTGFESRLKPNVYCVRFGEFTTDIDIESLKIPGDTVVWIAADGDDANDGTESSPKKTLAGAFAVSGCTTVMIKEGAYLIDEHFTASLNIGGYNLIGVGNVVFDATDNAGYIIARSSAYVENIEFIGGNTCLNAKLADTDTFCINKCKLHDCISSNALTVTGGNIYVIECEAFNTKLDGFNYHANTTNGSLPNVVEWNCYAHDCGDGSNTSSNGSTIHDGASIVRIGGEYCNCHGGVVADQGVDETTASYSVNFGVYAHSSTIATEGYEHFNASFWAQKYAEMWLYMCRSEGSTYDISSFVNSNVRSMSMISADMWETSDYIEDGSTAVRR